jgi:DNA-binding MarR family transcriptional regulator
MAARTTSSRSPQRPRARENAPRALRAARPVRRDAARPKAPPPPPLDERVSFIIHRINARLAQVCNPVFRRHHLDLYASRILAVLLERREVTVGELVDVMVLPQSTISHQLQRLEKYGLVQRRRKQSDNRSVGVTLTARGSTVAKECNDLSVEVYRTMTQNLSPGELDALRDLLRRIFASLQDFAPEER